MATKAKSTEKAHLSIDGEMTIYRAAEIKETLSSALAANKIIEVDLSRVTEMDSAGLQLMVSLKRESVARKMQLSFVGHSEAVRDVLDTCDLGGFFGDPVVIH